jgi:hypothetical protein
VSESFELPNAVDLPAPSHLSWGWVLLLNVFTGGVFGAFWMLQISRWVRRVRGVSNAYGWAYVYLVVAVLSASYEVSALFKGAHEYLHGYLDAASCILFLVVAFLLQGEMEERPIALSLSSVMTFFFAPVYFQYHLQTFGERDGVVPGKTLKLSTPD